jgi:hypothetical protein
VNVARIEALAAGVILCLIGIVLYVFFCWRPA